MYSPETNGELGSRLAKSASADPAANTMAFHRDAPPHRVRGGTPGPAGHAGRRRANRVLHLLALAAAAMLLAAHVAEDEPRVGGATTDQPWPGDPILYDLEVRGPDGDLLFRPRILGEADRLASLELWGESAAYGRDPRLRLLVDALAAKDGLDLSLDLTVGGLVEQHNFRLRMPMNEQRTIRVPTDDGRSLSVSLRAFKVGSEAFGAYIDAVERRALAGRMPEA